MSPRHLRRRIGDIVVNRSEERTMPTRDTALIGAPCWVDLMSSDTDRSRAFYTNLFGWSAEDPSAEFGGYFNFTKDGIRLGGCMGSPEPSGPDVWSVYLASDDAAKTADAATANGGQIYVEPMAVADLGTMAVVSDSGGAAIGIWQPGLHQGFGVFGEPGTPSWFELFTRDYDRTVAFYRDVFRWDTQVMGDTTEFRYTTLVHDEEQYAGIMDATSFLPEGVPAHWSVYFGADDTDATLTRTVELGGAVVVPAEDTPYGRLATASDPTGAVFKLVGPSATTS
jgi:predicted enzyme related to lactoylglutathione lyase